MKSFNQSESSKNLTYTIHDGDSIYDIANRYGITISQITDANPELVIAYSAYVGKTIDIPESFLSKLPE
ncbi:MAG: LysM domain-containing protein [Clostridiaceae bacterium]|nr:LysM domain-containing protein [Clostridiaceae bacterium]